MSKRLVFPVLALVAMSLGASFNGCSCSGEAKVGNMEAKAPEPPPPPPPTPPPAPTQDTPPPAPAVKVVKNVKLDGNKVSIPGELEFDVDKATIKDTQQSKDILNTLVEFLKQNPSVTKLRIEGHTDNSGKADHNMKLSNDRAAAVAAWLGKNGVDATRLHAIGFGQDKPLVPNDSADHKAMNRRTEFHVEEIDGKPAPTADSSGSGSSTGTAAASGTGAAGAATPAAAGSTAAATPAAAGDKAAAAAPGKTPKTPKAPKTPAPAGTAAPKP